MGAISAASVTKHSAGDQTKLVVVFSSVTDGDTYASGLGANIQDYSYQMVGNASTQASAGASIAESSGTFTFYPGEDSLSGQLVIYASV